MLHTIAYQYRHFRLSNTRQNEHASACGNFKFLIFDGERKREKNTTDMRAVH